MLWNAQCSFLCLNVNKTEKPHTHIFSKPERSGLSEWPPSSCLLSVCGFGFGISRCAVSDVRACACSASVCVCGCVVGMLWLVIKDVQKQKLGGVCFKGAPKRNKVAASHNV